MWHVEANVFFKANFNIYYKTFSRIMHDNCFCIVQFNLSSNSSFFKTLHMQQILIISSSIRTGRKSDRVGLYLMHQINSRNDATATIVDLHEYNLPLFHERFNNLPSPPETLIRLADAIVSADSVIMVTPEYNGGYPAALKNMIDVFFSEWKRKPVAFATVSSGPFAGMNVITSIQYVMWKIGACTVPVMFPVPSVEQTIDENGNALQPEATNKRAHNFIEELIWYGEALQFKKAKTAVK
jgi:NAD(P)H-dependent FMN reductase